MPIKTKQIENGKLLDSIYAKIEKFEGAIATLTNDNAIRKLEDINTAGRIETLDASVEALKTSVEKLGADIGDDIAERINALSSSVEELKAHGSSGTADIQYATMDEINDLIPKEDDNTLILLPSFKVTLNDYDENLRDKVDATGKLPWNAIDFSYVDNAEHLFKADEFGDGLTTIPKLKYTKNVINFSELFSLQKNLVEVPAFENLDSCKSLSRAFYGCSKLKTVPELPEFAYGCSCADMFDGCSDLETAPVISGAIGYAQGMFRNCTSLKIVPTLKTADMKSINRYYDHVYFNGTFAGCTELEEAPEIQGPIGDTTYMFKNCKKLKTVPEYDLSRTVLMTGMFEGSGLSGEFPWEIDLSSIGGAGSTNLQTTRMFDKTSVTKVTFKNVPGSIRGSIEKIGINKVFYLKDNPSDIEIVIKNYRD